MLRCSLPQYMPAMAVTAVLLIAGFLVPSVNAEPHRFAEYGFSMDLPDSGWTIVPDAGSAGEHQRILLSATNHAATKQLNVIAMGGVEAFDSTMLSEEGLGGYLTGIRDRGALILDSGIVEISGQRAFRVVMGIEAEGSQRIPVFSLFIPRGERAIMVMATSQGTHPAYDEELQAIIAGIRLDYMPAAKTSSRSRSLPPAAESWGSRFVGVLIFGGTVALIVYLVRRRRRRQEEEFQREVEEM